MWDNFGALGVLFFEKFERISRERERFYILLKLTKSWGLGVLYFEEVNRLSGPLVLYIWRKLKECQGSWCFLFWWGWKNLGAPSVFFSEMDEKILETSSVLYCEEFESTLGQERMSGVLVFHNLNKLTESWELWYLIF